MKSYNGFSGEERSAGGDLLRKLFAVKGNMKTGQCCLCHRRGVVTHTHQENYYDFYNFWELCVQCHINLHSRQKNLRNWKVYAYLAATGSLGDDRMAFSNVMNYFSSPVYKVFFSLGRAFEVEAMPEEATDEQKFLYSLNQETDYRNGLIDTYGEGYFGKMRAEIFVNKNYEIFDRIILDNLKN